MIIWGKSDMMPAGVWPGLPSLDARARNPGLRSNRAREAAGRAPGGLAWPPPQPRGLVVTGGSRLR